MLNNLTILFVVITLFVYFGGKNVPKELSKYKLLIVGLTCGLIVCSFVKRNVEAFTVGSYNGDSAGGCVQQQQNDYHTNNSEVYDNISKLHENIDLCKHEYLNQLRQRSSGKTHTLKGTRIGEIHDDTSGLKNYEWCSNPANINDNDNCYNCDQALNDDRAGSCSGSCSDPQLQSRGICGLWGETWTPSPHSTQTTCESNEGTWNPRTNNVPKVSDEPYASGQGCLRCSMRGGSKQWGSTECPRDPSCSANDRRRHWGGC
jgi:hypothetical protein